MSHSLEAIIKFASRLEAAKIHFELDLGGRDSLLFMVTVPGERWEVEFLVDGSVDVEVFVSDGSISDATKVEELFERFGD